MVRMNSVTPLQALGSFWLLLSTEMWSAWGFLEPDGPVESNRVKSSGDLCPGFDSKGRQEKKSA